MTLLHRKILSVIVLVIALCALFWVALIRNTTAVDWNLTYYPAARALVELKSPYQQAPLFFAPVWSLIPLIPFIILPPNVGGAFFFVVSILGFAYLGYRVGCKPLGIAALLLSAPVANCLQTGNIEWIPLLGALMPFPVGLIFLSMKPQATIGIMIFILITASKQGFQNVLRISIPTVILFTLNCLVYGFWFLRFGGAFKAAGYFVIRLWPYGILIGLVCLFLAIRRQDINFAMAASPMLSPYTILLTWSGFVLSFARSTKAITLVSVISWIFWIAFRTIK